jgi:predicted GIY-YIG superfamily endonuclease
MSFYVYAIQSASGRIYVGQTGDVNKRLSLHNAGAVHSTKADSPWVLFKIQGFDAREQARYFEWELKRSRGKRQKWLDGK